MNRFLLTCAAGAAALALAGCETPLEDGAARAPAAPVVVARADGGAEVQFRNGCAVRYDRQGARRGQSGKCGPNIAARADEAYRTYRRNR